MECRVESRPLACSTKAMKTYYYNYDDFENLVLDMGYLGADYVVTDSYAHLSDRLLKMFEEILHCKIITVTCSKKLGYKGVFLVTNSH